MPYTCPRCNHKFCSEHRLPENHNCPYLVRGGKSGEQIQQEIIAEDKNSSNTTNKLNKYINKYEGRYWLILLATIIVTYILQLLTIVLFGEQVHNSIFILQSNQLQYVWTYITSIFSHDPSGFYHLFGNSIILLFFGRLLEQIIGSKKFILLYLISGLIAGLSQVTINMLFIDSVSGVLGASGALLAVLGTLTIYKPKMKVYLYFLVPIPLWLVTSVVVITSFIGFFGFMSGVAHIAHLVGLMIGMLYGYKTKNKYYVPNKLQV